MCSHADCVDVLTRWQTPFLGAWSTVTAQCPGLLLSDAVVTMCLAGLVFGIAFYIKSQRDNDNEPVMHKSSISNFTSQFSEGQEDDLRGAVPCHTRCRVEHIDRVCQLACHV